MALALMEAWIVPELSTEQEEEGHVEKTLAKGGLGIPVCTFFF